MKKLLRSLALAALPLAGVHAQVDVDFFGALASIPQANFSRYPGGGFSMLSRPFALNGFPATLQAGGGFYVTGKGRQLDDGASSLSFNNALTGMHGIARFSFPQSSPRSPYVDLFAGTRIASATVTRHSGADHDNCVSESTNSWNANVGAGAGMLFRLAPNMYLDLGLQWSYSPGNSHFIDLHSITNTGDGITYRTQNVPPGMLLLKAGLHFRTIKSDCICSSPCDVPSHHGPSCPYGK